MTHYDDIAGRDLPDIEDLIEGTENAGDDLDSFLTNKLRRLSAQPDLPLPIEPEKPRGADGRAAMEKPGYLESGFTKSQQDARKEGEVPTPIIAEADEAILHAASTLPPETTTVMEIRTHPIIGTYLTEHQEVVDEDPEDLEIYHNVKKFAISQMQPEQVIEIMHKNEKAVRKTRVANNALKSALEEMLMGMNSTRRAEILEKDRTYRTPKKAKATPKPGEAAKPRTSTKQAFSPLEKLIKKTFVDEWQMGEAEILKEVEERGKLTDDVRKFISALFPKD